MARYSSSPAENSSQDAPKPPGRPVRLHHLREFDQPDGGGELWIFHRSSDSPGSLSVSQMRRHFKNFLGKMIDAVEQAAAAREKDARAQVVDERFLIEPALEELKSLAQSQMDNRVERFPFDFLAGKTRFVLQDDHFPGQRIAKNAAAFLDF